MHTKIDFITTEDPQLRAWALGDATQVRSQLAEVMQESEIQNLDKQMEELGAKPKDKVKLMAFILRAMAGPSPQAEGAGSSNQQEPPTPSQDGNTMQGN